MTEKLSETTGNPEDMITICNGLVSWNELRFLLIYNLPAEIITIANNHVPLVAEAPWHVLLHLLFTI